MGEAWTKHKENLTSVFTSWTKVKMNVRIKCNIPIPRDNLFTIEIIPEERKVKDEFIPSDCKTIENINEYIYIQYHKELKQKKIGFFSREEGN